MNFNNLTDPTLLNRMSGNNYGLRTHIVTNRRKALKRKQQLETLGEFAAAALIVTIPFLILFI